MNKTLKEVLKGIDPAWTKKRKLYVGLCNKDGETKYPGYKRASLTKLKPGKKQISNAMHITFPMCGVEVLTHVAIYDKDGALIYKGRLKKKQKLQPRLQPQFAPGSLIMTED